jgi:hypothetical protein
MSTERLPPERLRMRQLAYLRACLRPDNVPADRVVQKIFDRLQQARRRAADHVERDLWGHLLTYLSTLECDDDVGRPTP